MFQNLKTNTLRRSVYHPFHIVDPSPWPITVAFVVFFTLFGFVLYMHSFKLGFFLFIFGLIATVFNTSLWWRDVVREGTFEGAHTFQVRHGLRFGMVLFIVSEIMLFFAFFWAFFHSTLNPVPEIGGVWPPKGIDVVDPWTIPLLNTALLLTSGSSLTYAHTGLLGGYKDKVKAGLEVTIYLAVIFTALQAFEYVNAPFNITDSVYGSVFYMLTGLHGMHVIVGTLMLLVSYQRFKKEHFTIHNHVGFESAAWYWHFVDVVWIYLFLAVYIWGAGSF